MESRDLVLEVAAAKVLIVRLFEGAAVTGGAAVVGLQHVPSRLHEVLHASGPVGLSLAGGPAVLVAFRFVMGVGFGWNDEEFEDHGFSAEHKRTVAIEKIKMMRQIWTQDEASFDGEHLKLSPSWSWPKP